MHGIDVLKMKCQKTIDLSHEEKHFSLFPPPFPPFWPMHPPFCDLRFLSLSEIMNYFELAWTRAINGIWWVTIGTRILYSFTEFDDTRITYLYIRSKTLIIVFILEILVEFVCSWKDFTRLPILLDKALSLSLWAYDTKRNSYRRRDMWQFYQMNQMIYRIPISRYNRVLRKTT